MILNRAAHAVDLQSRSAPRRLAQSACMFGDLRPTTAHHWPSTIPRRPGTDAPAHERPLPSGCDHECQSRTRPASSPSGHPIRRNGNRPRPASYRARKAARASSRVRLTKLNPGDLLIAHRDSGRPVNRTRHAEPPTRSASSARNRCTRRRPSRWNILEHRQSPTLCSRTSAAVANTLDGA